MSQQNVQPIPQGYHTVTPYLIVKDANQAIAFYKKAFNAKEIMRFNKPDGRIGHAEIQMGDSRIMLADEFPQMQAHSPAFHQGSPVKLHLYVSDVDTLFQQAVAAGAKVIRPLADQPYGDRSGGLLDPEGHSWFLATHQKDMTESELQSSLNHSS